MTRTSLLIVAALLVLAPSGALYAQDEDGSRDRGDNPAVGRAVERPAPAPAPERSAPAPRPAPRAETAPAPAPAQPAAAADDQRRRDRDGSRDRGDNPAVGRAVPRDSGRAAPPPPPSSRGGNARNDGYRRGPNVYVAPYNYYYYPRRYYPYGYGAFGLGYFYYDPYTWYPPSYYSGYDSGYFGSGFFEGELRLQVTPRGAEVYVDGYFAGRVDDFDGVFQSLKLEEGPHHIQIAAPGYAPLDFDVRIEPDRKITYRGALVPYRP